MAITIDGSANTIAGLAVGGVPNGTIDADALAADCIDESKIANNGIDSEHYNAGSIDISHLSASGTASSSTYLRGDNTWSAVSGGVSSDAQDNTVAGTNAGDSFTGTDAINNSFYGKDAGTAVTSGDNNVGIGFESFKSANTASQNTCIGSKAGASITGGNNVCVGFRAGEDATSADSCIAIGKSAYDGANTGNENIAIGVGAMGDAAVCTGQRNICIGTDAGKSITAGEYNVAIGYQALDASIEGGSNTAVGAFALGALDANTTGNVAVGMKAGMNLDGDHTTFIGWKCGEDATSGYHNTGVGSQALLNVSTGYSSTAVGYQALKTLTTGLEATAIGYQAGLDYNANGGVFVGRWAGKTNATDQNTILYIARNADSAGNNGCWIYGNDVGQCFNGDNSSSWNTTSDQRLKKDIVDNNVGLSVIDNVKVRNFKYKQYDKSGPVLYTEDDQEVKDGLIEVGEEKSPSIFTTPKTSEDTIDLSGFKAGTTAHNVVIGQGKTETQIGVIAQEIEAVCPGCVKTDDFGAKTVNTDELFWHMINAIKELSTKVKALEAA